MKIVLLIKKVIDVKSALQFGLPTEIKLAKIYSHHLLYLSKSPQVGSKFLKKLGVSWLLKQQSMRENKSLKRHIPPPQTREKALAVRLHLDYDTREFPTAFPNLT